MDLKLVALLAAVVLGLVLFFVLGERAVVAPDSTGDNAPLPTPAIAVSRLGITIEGGKQSYIAELHQAAGLEAEGSKVEPRVLIEGAACSRLLAPEAAAELPVAGLAKRVFIEGAATAAVSTLPVWDATPIPTPATRIVIESSATVSVLEVGEGIGEPLPDAVTGEVGITIDGAATSAVYELVGAQLP